jgi:hypothetical protein
VRTNIWIVDRRVAHALAAERPTGVRIAACGRSKWTKNARQVLKRPMHLRACDDCIRVLNGERPARPRLAGVEPVVERQLELAGDWEAS